jgi:hypothetical protein
MRRWFTIALALFLLTQAGWAVVCPEACLLQAHHAAPAGAIAPMDHHSMQSCHGGPAMGAGKDCPSRSALAVTLPASDPRAWIVAAGVTPVAAEVTAASSRLRFPVPAHDRERTLAQSSVLRI